MMSASPRLMISLDSPTAWPPVAQADTVANHTGAKGLAEPPIIGIAPAIANAVADALGLEMTEIPLTPWRVLRRD